MFLMSEVPMYSGKSLNKTVRAPVVNVGLS